MEEHKKRKTVGAAASELMQQTLTTRDPIELQRSMQEDYFDELVECVSRNKSSFDGNFFIVVITKKERLMPNVIRNYFFARNSCPTPDYDQAVYRYHAQDELIEYLWCIPDKQTCLLLKENALEVQEKDLLQHVLDFADGSLFALAKKLNSEQYHSPFLES